MISNLHTDEYSEEEYTKAYGAIYSVLTGCAHQQGEKRAYILGGQPGSGKSTFYSGNESLNGYVTINGDQYRKYHPRYDDIVKYDLDNYANRTQSFVNQVVEQLINDLSDGGYSIIIEGTLRNPTVPIKTCELLKEKGYNTRLVVVACNAERSWKSTMLRAHLMQEMGEKPRFVPIDKYNMIVNNLPDSLDAISNKQCFDCIKIINRDNDVLYRNGEGNSPSQVLRDELDLDTWNNRFMKHAQDYMNEKIELLKKESERLYEQKSFSHTYEEVSTRER
jgi:UDP-N-acetylglucosamine kinase